jgi:hypothetical protein
MIPQWTYTTTSILVGSHERPTWKYLTAGITLADEPISVVAKLALTWILVIIIVYQVE